jgi:hypothetical protein
MKIAIQLFSSLFLIAAPFLLVGQEIAAPVYYIDSIEVDFNSVYINPNSIESIYVEKETENGAIYITTKKHFKFISIDQVLEDNTDTSLLSNSLLFRINGSVVERLDDLLIDDSFFVYIENENLSNVEYIEDKYTSLQIINIDLEAEKRKKEIRIRK